ncbi:MAG: hypothetical protein K6B43_03215 [Treponema sp.]|nr:hypothetical protein [Treponema sp.]
MIKNLFIIVCVFMLVGCAPLINENFGESEHQTSNEQTSFSFIKLQIDSAEYTMNKEDDCFYVVVDISSGEHGFCFSGYANGERKAWSNYISILSTGTYTLYEVSSSYGRINLSEDRYRIEFYPSLSRMTISYIY